VIPVNAQVPALGDMADSFHTTQSPDTDRWRHSVEKEEDHRSEEDVITHVADPFGDEEHAETKYRTLTWWQCGMIMIAETISLGILSLPSAVAVLGLVPYVVLLPATSMYFNMLTAFQCNHSHRRAWYTSNLHWICDRPIQTPIPAST
jgi:hypothetical protein